MYGDTIHPAEHAACRPPHRPGGVGEACLRPGADPRSHHRLPCADLRPPGTDAPPLAGRRPSPAPTPATTRGRPHAARNLPSGPAHSLHPCARGLGACPSRHISARRPCAATQIARHPHRAPQPSAAPRRPLHKPPPSPSPANRPKNASLSRRLLTSIILRY